MTSKLSSVTAPIADIDYPSDRQDTAGDPRWQCVLKRDTSTDGQFWYSVSTTQVYCRPSCPSRHARPEHVCLHDTLEAARATGYRPCRRCQPEGPSLRTRNARVVAQVCRTIERSVEFDNTELSLATLAASVGKSSRYLHHLFKSLTGLTPKAYAAAHRAMKLRDVLGQSRSVTDSLYESGFSSSGRFYENTDRILGMTPGRYRHGGKDEEIHFAVGQCSLGAIMVAASRKGVVSILLGDDADALLRDLQDRFPRANLIGADQDFETLVARVVGLVEHPTKGIDLPLDVRGTAFQQRVWIMLRDIPARRTMSYAEIARRIGSQVSELDVANACATNPLAVAIPCHRVIRTDGTYWGYAWGIDRKQALLDRER
ncbi:TPA: bifunctional DNA-binding transcriptional regulator/O6-methylguanine-DNA methyltransferase Ada [Pseudomonas aeruginosa]